MAPVNNPVEPRRGWHAGGKGVRLTCKPVPKSITAERLLEMAQEEILTPTEELTEEGTALVTTEGDEVRRTGLLVALQSARFCVTSQF